MAPEPFRPWCSLVLGAALLGPSPARGDSLDGVWSSQGYGLVLELRGALLPGL